MRTVVTGAVLLACCLRVGAAAEVINAGRGGHNTRNLLARLERDALARKPSLVVLMVGTNDMLNSRNAVPLEEYEANLRNEANSRAADGVHPTAEGYRAIADAVAKAIARHTLPASRVVCLGDSITFGSGVKGAGTATGETYPACLARLLSDSSDRDEKGTP